MCWRRCFLVSPAGPTPPLSAPHSSLIQEGGASPPWPCRPQLPVVLQRAARLQAPTTNRFQPCKDKRNKMSRVLKQLHRSMAAFKETPGESSRGKTSLPTQKASSKRNTKHHPVLMKLQCPHWSLEQQFGSTPLLAFLAFCLVYWTCLEQWLHASAKNPAHVQTSFGLPKKQPDWPKVKNEENWNLSLDCWPQVDALTTLAFLWSKVSKTQIPSLARINANYENRDINAAKAFPLAYLKTSTPQPAMAVKILGPMSLVGLMA